MFVWVFQPNFLILSTAIAPGVGAVSEKTAFILFPPLRLARLSLPLPGGLNPLVVEDVEPLVHPYQLNAYLVQRWNPVFGPLGGVEIHYLRPINPHCFPLLANI